MNFYTQQHKHYCGIDLHARAMYVCILDQHGTKLVHKNLPTTPEAFWRKEFTSQPSATAALALQLAELPTLLARAARSSLMRRRRSGSAPA